MSEVVYRAYEERARLERYGDSVPKFLEKFMKASSDFKEESEKVFKSFPPEGSDIYKFGLTQQAIHFNKIIRAMKEEIRFFKRERLKGRINGTPTDEEIDSLKINISEKYSSFVAAASDVHGDYYAFLMALMKFGYVDVCENDFLVYSMKEKKYYTLEEIRKNDSNAFEDNSKGQYVLFPRPCFNKGLNGKFVFCGDYKDRGIESLAIYCSIEMIFLQMLASDQKERDKIVFCFGNHELYGVFGGEGIPDSFPLIGDLAKCGIFRTGYQSGKLHFSHVAASSGVIEEVFSVLKIIKTSSGNANVDAARKEFIEFFNSYFDLEEIRMIDELAKEMQLKSVDYKSIEKILGDKGFEFLLKVRNAVGDSFAILSAHDSKSGFMAGCEQLMWNRLGVSGKDTSEFFWNRVACGNAYEYKRFIPGVTQVMGHDYPGCHREVVKFDDLKKICSHNEPARVVVIDCGAGCTAGTIRQETIKTRHSGIFKGAGQKRIGRSSPVVFNEGGETFGMWTTYCFRDDNFLASNELLGSKAEEIVEVVSIKKRGEYEKFDCCSKIVNVCGYIKDIQEDEEKVKTEKDDFLPNSSVNDQNASVSHEEDEALKKKDKPPLHQGDEELANDKTNSVETNEKNKEYDDTVDENLDESVETKGKMEKGDNDQNNGSDGNRQIKASDQGSHIKIDQFGFNGINLKDKAWEDEKNKIDEPLEGKKDSVNGSSKGEKVTVYKPLDGEKDASSQLPINRTVVSKSQSADAIETNESKKDDPTPKSESGMKNGKSDGEDKNSVYGSGKCETDGNNIPKSDQAVNSEEPKIGSERKCVVFEGEEVVSYGKEVSEEELKEIFGNSIDDQQDVTEPLQDSLKEHFYQNILSITNASDISELNNILLDIDEHSPSLLYVKEVFSTLTSDSVVTDFEYSENVSQKCLALIDKNRERMLRIGELFKDRDENELKLQLKIWRVDLNVLASLIYNTAFEVAKQGMELKEVLKANAIINRTINNKNSKIDFDKMYIALYFICNCSGEKQLPIVKRYFNHEVKRLGESVNFFLLKLELIIKLILYYISFHSFYDYLRQPVDDLNFSRLLMFGTRASQLPLTVAVESFSENTKH